MEGFANDHKRFKQFEIPNSIAQAIEFNNSIKEKFGFLDSQVGPFSEIRRFQKMFKNDFADSLAFKNFIEQYKMPNSMIETIESIKRHQEMLFSGLNSFNSIYSNSQSLINSAQSAMQSITSQVAYHSAFLKDWEYLNQFGEISKEVLELNEKLGKDEGLSREEFVEIKQTLSNIYSSLLSVEKDTSSVLMKWLTIIGFILTLISEGRNWVSKPNFITKEEFQSTMQEFYNKNLQQLNKQNQQRIVNHNCKIYFKPNTKSNVVLKIENGYNLVVVDVRKEWVFVSFSDPKDNLPQTGWIQKKYLK